MKLLGLRLCEHDSNISYFDGSSLHYYKSERKYQVKHHAIHDLIKWRDEINDLWNLDYKEIAEQELKHNMIPYKIRSTLGCPFFVV